MVESVLRNSIGHEVQFYFVDNGSTDGTYEYLSSLPQVAQIIRNPTNVGVNPAWNQLLGQAIQQGPDVIVLANNDILAGPGWLDPVVRELAKNDHRYFLPNGDLHNDGTFEDDARAGYIENAGKTVAGRGGWCLFFRVEAIKLFLPIPERMTLWYGDDYIHWVLQQQNGYRCETLLDSYCLHYVSKSIAEFPNRDQVIAEDRKAFEEITGAHLP